MLGGGRRPHIPSGEVVLALGKVLRDLSRVRGGGGGGGVV